MLNPTLHERVAESLKWTVTETQSVPLHALRELVRPVSPKLCAELTGAIQRQCLTRPSPRGALGSQRVSRPR